MRDDRNDQVWGLIGAAMIGSGGECLRCGNLSKHKLSCDFRDVPLGRPMTEEKDPIDIGDNLEDITEDLNAALVRAEELFIEMNLGVAAEVQLYNDDDRLTVLLFNNVKGTWGLFVKTPKGVAPLRSAARGDRVAAAEKLDALYEKLMETANAKTGHVKSAVEQVEKFIRRRST